MSRASMLASSRMSRRPLLCALILVASCGVADEIDVFVPIRTAIPEKTDIRIRASSDVANTEVRTRVLGWLVAD